MRKPNPLPDGTAERLKELLEASKDKVRIPEDSSSLPSGCDKYDDRVYC